MLSKYIINNMPVVRFKIQLVKISTFEAIEKELVFSA